MTEIEKSARCFVKCAGGKTKLLPELLKRIPEKFGVYFEPFVGGGALFWALAAKYPQKRMVIGDTNTDLITTYRVIRNDVTSLIKRLRGMRNGYEDFMRVRKRKPNPAIDPTGVAARFIYLNKTCFNGLYRVNKKGEFNVPFGRYDNPKICDEVNLRACSELMFNKQSGLTIRCNLFEITVVQAKKGDFVYFDPPYLPLSKTSNFTAYSAEGFGIHDHVLLRDVARQLKRDGVKVMISNSDCTEIREIYARGFKITEVEAPRSINSKVGGRGKISELIIQ